MKRRIGEKSGRCRRKRLDFRKSESKTQRDGKRWRKRCQETACFSLFHSITHPCSHSLNPVLSASLFSLLSTLLLHSGSMSKGEVYDAFRHRFIFLNLSAAKILLSWHKQKYWKTIQEVCRSWKNLSNIHPPLYFSLLDARGLTWLTELSSTSFSCFGDLQTKLLNFTNPQKSGVTGGREKTKEATEWDICLQETVLRETATSCFGVQMSWSKSFRETQKQTDKCRGSTYHTVSKQQFALK